MMITDWPKDMYVLIPSYKSIGQLRPFIESLTRTVPKEYVCVVDDASNDGTYEYCIDSGIDCVRHHRNRGKGAALRTGFSHIISTKGVNTDKINIDTDNLISTDINTVDISTDTDINVDTNPPKCKWILTMDADGQHSPTDIPGFIAESKKLPPPGICIGARDMRLRSMPAARIISNRLTSLILSILTKRRVVDSQCGYRLYSAEFIKSIQIEYNRFQAESELIQKAVAKHFPIRFKGVQTLYLSGGSSHISHLLDTLRWIAAVGRVWFKLTFTDGRRNF